MAFLENPCVMLKGVGPKLLEKLRRINIHSFADLLLHLPFRYQDRTHVISIRDLRVGDQAVVEGVIEKIQIQQKNKMSVIIHFSDLTGRLKIRFFHFKSWQAADLTIGARLRCFGEVRLGRMGKEMIHPEYKIIHSTECLPLIDTLTPIYPSTEGLHQATLRQLVEQVRIHVNEHTFPDWIPPKLRADFELPHIAEAISFIHHPSPEASLHVLEERKHPAQQRLAFEELLAHQLSLKLIRKRSDQHLASVLKENESAEQALIQSLNFHLTTAQKRVIHEIKVDLQKPYPMHRLVQGDVGSGKTIVAAFAMLKAAANNYQAALMAPTELLAEQHYSNLQQWAAPLGIQVSWLAGKHKGRQRKQILEKIAGGETQWVVGTHALFQEEIHFKNLALIVVDEQHRFGVTQRLALKEKGLHDGKYPHLLVMSATPIPRTLAMSFFADLDVSVIDELPPGRTPIKTVAIPNSKRGEIIQRIREVCQKGRQAYWVCTLIEDSEILENQAAESLAVNLRELLPELKIGLVHGRMNSQEKETVMAAFKEHQLDLLVATTVIEVGVDVPNASLMIIENAERMGLSQLHQLRGRVGRGSIESFCVLMYQAPLTETAKKRLEVLRESQDGFEIAKQDLLLRGPGEWLGTKQTGSIRFRIADLVRDQSLLPKIQKIADILLEYDVTLAEKILRRWIPEGNSLSTV